MEVKCEKCGSTVANIIGDSLVEVIRQGQKLQVIGKDYTVMLSCPNTEKCSNKVAITVENGKVLDNLNKKEEKNEQETPKSSTDEKSGKGEGDESQKENSGGQNGDGNGEQGKGEESKSNDVSGTSGDSSESRKYTRI